MRNHCHARLIDKDAPNNPDGKLNKVAVTLLDREGVLHSYEVTETFVVGPFDHSIRTQGEREELPLFTCAEKGTKRFVVKCAPASEEVAYEE